MRMRDFLNYFDQLTEETDEEAISRLEREIAELETGAAPADTANAAPADTANAAPAIENPGFEGQQLEIWNLLSPEQKRWATGSKGTGMPNLMDPVIQSRISRVKGGTMLVDPDRQKEITKAVLAANPGRSGPPDMTARKRLADLAYQPGTELPKPYMAPIVDKSTTYKPDRNANLANNQIGDAYGVLSTPTTTSAPPVTTGSTQTVGKPSDDASTAQAQTPAPAPSKPPAQSYSPEPDSTKPGGGGSTTGGGRGGYSQGLPPGSLDSVSAKVNNNAAQVSTAQTIRDLMKKIG